MIVITWIQRMPNAVATHPVSLAIWGVALLAVASTALLLWWTDR